MSASDGGARAKTTVSYVALMCGHGLTATAAAATVRAGHCGDRSRLEAPTIAFLTPQRRLAYPLAPLTCTIRPLSFTAIDAICTANRQSIDAIFTARRRRRAQHRARPQQGAGPASPPPLPSGATTMRVACCGEHTTHSGHPEFLPEYPGRVDALLGSEVDVQNFGFAMATACRKNAPAGGKTTFFADTAEAAQCVEFKPDVIVLGPSAPSPSPPHFTPPHPSHLTPPCPCAGSASRTRWAPSGTTTSTPTSRGSHSAKMSTLAG